MAKGLAFEFLDNSMKLEDNPASRFMVTMLRAVAELERSFIRQRQTESLAKEQGKFRGRSRSKSETKGFGQEHSRARMPE